MEVTQKSVALVLGAAVWPGGQPSPTLRRRTLCAVALWKAGRVDDIIVCGGVGQHAPSEAAVMASLCRSAGVSSKAIHLEDMSATTEENLRFAVPVLGRINAAHVVLVTDLYHVPRARLVARRLGLSVGFASPPLRSAKPWAFTKAALREVPAFALYWMVGRGKPNA